MNIYDRFALRDVNGLFVLHHGISDSVLHSNVGPALELLDGDVVVRAWGRQLRQTYIALPTRSRGSLQSDFTLVIDPEAGVIGLRGEHTALQWDMPKGFLDLFTEGFSNATATPRPTRPPPPPTISASEFPTRTPRPTGTPVPQSDIFFEHPVGELFWDGPDDRVRSIGRAHCEPPREVREAYGVPDLVVTEPRGSFWFGEVTEREEGWRWTGYYHGNWQIWQADDPLVLYLIHDDEEEIAFLYKVRPCI